MATKDRDKGQGDDGSEHSDSDAITRHYRVSLEEFQREAHNRLERLEITPDGKTQFVRVSQAGNSSI
jgi:hypothetical protein